jgi:RecA-family ATPase
MILTSTPLNADHARLHNRVAALSPASRTEFDRRRELLRSQDNAAMDADHADLEARGELIDDAPLLTEWQANRSAQRAAAELQMGAIRAAWSRVMNDPDSTDEMNDAAFAMFEKASVEWKARHGHLWSADQLSREQVAIAASSILPPGTPMPSPSNWTPSTNVVALPAAAPAPRLRPRRLDASTLAGRAVPEREWLIPGLIPAGNVTLLYGDGGTGKSLLALQLGMAVAVGTHFFGRPVIKGAVEYITAEDSIEEMHRRLADVCRSTRTPIASLIGLHLSSLADEDALLATPEDGKAGSLIVTPLYSELDAVLSESRPALLVLDTLADVYGGNEIVRSQVRQFVGMLRRLSLRHGVTIVVLAHPSVAGMDKGTSGSTGWSNSVRSRLYFDRIRDEGGREMDEDARVLRVQKSNYGRIGLEIPMRWEAGAFIPVAVSVGDPLVQQQKADKAFLDLLAKFTLQGRPVSLATGSNYAPKLFEADARALGVGKRALAVAMTRLLDAGMIEQIPYGAPSRGTKQLVSTNKSNA